MKTITVQTQNAGDVLSVIRPEDRNHSLSDRELAELSFKACSGMCPNLVTIEDDMGKIVQFDFIGH